MHTHMKGTQQVLICLIGVLSLLGCDDTTTSPDFSSPDPLADVSVTTFVAAQQAEAGDTVAVEYLVQLRDEQRIASFEATLHWEQDHFEYLGGESDATENVVAADMSEGWARIRVTGLEELEARRLTRYYLAVTNGPTEGFGINDVIVVTAEAKDDNGAEAHES